MIERHFQETCFNPDFGHQMRFVAGPRQVGKTTLARSFLSSSQMPKGYFNWAFRDLHRIADMENVAAVMSLLPERVGSALSLHAIRKDAGIGYPAVKNCVSALQFAYVLFLVPPYSAKISRAIKKEKKG